MPSDPISQKPVYLDTSLPLTERVTDLISRLTLREKVSQMTHEAPAIPRLGIPAYNFWSEGLHGVARNGRATVYPQAIGMAATWDREMIQKVASSISEEARAKHHEAMRRNGYTSIYQGLTFWSPNINIFRDPRWGRGQETWGEDPYLTGEMGSAFVRGMQGDHPVYLKVAACAKHFAVHSGPEKDRHTFNAVVSKRDLNTTYLPAFKKLVTQAKVEIVMGAYNRTNDEPCCASQLLLVETLRKQWGFQGHVVSDCGALNDIHAHHKVTQDAMGTAILALKAGCDISCGTYDLLEEAIERGLISEADIDCSLARTVGTRFKLGMFDPPSQVPYTTIPVSAIHSPDHQQLAYEAAQKSVVLLKNRNDVLPIGDNVHSLIIVGPTAASLDPLLGNYYGVSESLTTLLEGIIGAAPEGLRIDYRPGCLLAQPGADVTNWSVYEACAADLTIACMGLSNMLEGEEGEAVLSTQNGDRSEIDLPKNQVDYLKSLAAQGAKVVLVLTGGSPIALGELEDLMEAIVFIWYPGEAGGKAVADLLFGKAVPSGKLPLTFPRSIDQLPPFEDYRMTGRTYRYATAEPLYPFGFGLSYTQFAYSKLKLAHETIAPGEGLPLHFTLTNQGLVEADEVAQIYLSDLEASVEVPFHTLIGFLRIHLKPGESREMAYTIQPEAMLMINDLGEQVLEPGQFRVTIGGCSPSARGKTLGAPIPVSAIFQVNA